ncbi:hypothetical protein SDC9_137034 [bioreactor metagenome]|uniref:Uncharacterized protein n=1 Tax=bioreactor metagenome TaxID=1076179 RepID=A0A645DKU6_9ZZZZ
MPFRIGVFEIDQQQVRHRQYVRNGAPRNRRRGVERGVDSLPPRQREKFPAELGMQQGFSAGKRHAAAGNPVEKRILLCVAEHRFRRAFHAAKFQRSRKTAFRTAAARGA